MTTRFPEFVDLSTESGWPFQLLENAHAWACFHSARDGFHRKIVLRRTTGRYSHRRWIVTVVAH